MVKCVITNRCFDCIVYPKFWLFSAVMMMLILVVYVIPFLVDKYSHILAGPVNVPTKNESSSIIVLNECSQAVNEDSWIPNDCLNGTVNIL